MADDNYTLDIYYRITNTRTGSYYSIGPDEDALGLIEIKFVTDDGTASGSVQFGEEELPLIIDALARKLDEMKNSIRGRNSDTIRSKE